MGSLMQQALGAIGKKPEEETPWYRYLGEKAAAALDYLMRPSYVVGALVAKAREHAYPIQQAIAELFGAEAAPPEKLPPLGQLLVEAITGERPITVGRIIAEQTAVKELSPFIRYPIEFIADVATDPLTYVGVGALTRQGKAAQKAGALAKTWAEQAKAGQRALITLAGRPLIKGARALGAIQRAAKATGRALKTPIALFKRTTGIPELDEVIAKALPEMRGTEEVGRQMAASVRKALKTAAKKTGRPIEELAGELTQAIERPTVRHMPPEVLERAVETQKRIINLRKLATALEATDDAETAQRLLKVARRYSVPEAIRIQDLNTNLTRLEKRVEAIKKAVDAIGTERAQSAKNFLRRIFSEQIREAPKGRKWKQAYNLAQRWLEHAEKRVSELRSALDDAAREWVERGHEFVLKQRQNLIQELRSIHRQFRRVKTPIAKELQPAVQAAKAYLAETRRYLKEAGLPVKQFMRGGAGYAVEGARLPGYLPHRLTPEAAQVISTLPPEQRAEIYSKISRAVKAEFGAMKQRKWSYARTIEEINRMAREGKFGAELKAVEAVFEPDPARVFEAYHREAARALLGEKVAQGAAKAAGRQWEKVTDAEQLQKIFKQAREAGENVYIRRRDALAILRAAEQADKSPPRWVADAIKAGEELIQVPPEAKVVGFKVARLPADIVAEVNRLVKPYFRPTLQEKAINRLVRAFDYIDQLLRGTTLYLFPSYHIRNFVDDLYRMVVGGFRNPVRLLQAGRLQRAIGLAWLSGEAGQKARQFLKSTIELGGKRWQWWRIAQEAMRHGVVGTGWMGVEKTFWRRVAEATWGKVLRPFAKAGTWLENNRRLAMFIDALAKGYKPADAAKIVRRFLYDYSKLSLFERRWLRRLIWFYSWFRQNIPFHMAMLLQKPSAYSIPLHAFDIPRRKAGALPPKLRQFLPWWIKANYGIEVGRKGKIWRYFLLGGWWSAADLARLANPKNFIIQQTTPFLRLPYIWSTGYYWGGDKVAWYEGQREKVLGVYMPVELARVIRGIRILRSIDNLMRIITGQQFEESQTAWQWLLGFLVSLRTYNVDLYKRVLKWVVRKRKDYLAARRAIRYYLRIGDRERAEIAYKQLQAMLRDVDKTYKEAVKWLKEHGKR